METITEVIKEIMIKVLLEDDEVEEISPEQPLTNYGVNSINIIQAVMQIEKEFNIIIEDKFLVSAKECSIKELAQYVKERMIN